MKYFINILLGLVLMTSIVLGQTQPIPLPKGYERLDQFPLDTRTVFTNYTEAINYAADLNNTGYEGQIIAVTEEGHNGVYYINNSRELSEIGGSLTIEGSNDDLPGYTNFPGTTVIRFDSGTGFKVRSIDQNKIEVSLGSSWYTLTVDVTNEVGTNMFTPKGEQPLQIRMNTDTNITGTSMDTNTWPWTLLIPSVGIPGKEGPPGGALIPYGYWTNNYNYSSNVMVRYTTNVYYSLVDNNSNNIPTNSPHVWQLFLSDGYKGDKGDKGEIFVSSTTTGLPGTDAKVEDDSIDPSVALLHFTIPRGDQGEIGPQGERGPAGELYIDSTSTGLPGTPASVTNISTNSSIARLQFTIPQGLQGIQGPIGPAGATLVPRGNWTNDVNYYENELVRYSTNVYYSLIDNNSNNVPSNSPSMWKLFLSDGYKGNKGDKGEVIVHSTETLPAGTNAVVEDLTSGNPSVATLRFKIPRGDKGEQGIQGEKGNAGELYITSTTTGLPGTPASVTNTSTNPSIAMLEFTIPQGLQGIQGPIGPAGATLVPYGNWVSNYNYPSNAIVRYLTSVYYNKAENSSNCVPTNCTDWVEFLKDGTSIAGDATVLFYEENPIFGRLDIDEDTLSVSNNLLTVIGGGGGGAAPWEIDYWGNLVPSTNNVPSKEWVYDEFGDLMPRVMP